MGDINIWLAIGLIVLALIIGAVVGYLVRVKTKDKSLAAAKSEAEKIISNAEAEAEKKKKESINEARNEIASLKKKLKMTLRKERMLSLNLKIN